MLHAHVHTLFLRVLTDAVWLSLCLSACARARARPCVCARPTHHLRERALQPPQQPTSAISGTLQRLQLLHRLAAAQKMTGPRSTTDEVVLVASVRY